MCPPAPGPRTGPALAGVLLLVGVSPLLAAEPSAAPLTFEKDVRPIFKALCFQCHGEEDNPKGKLDLRLVRLIRQGGKSGPAVVPGKPEDSLLWQRLAADEMPKGNKKLSAPQKDV